jgi:urea carboxylase
MVAAVEAAGLVWLGPAAASISDFALKHVAKGMAEAAGVPTLSGSPLVTTEDGVPSFFNIPSYNMNKTLSFVAA